MKKQVNGRDVKLKKHSVTRCASSIPIPVFSLVSENTKPVTRNRGVGKSLTFCRVEMPKHFGDLVRRLKCGFSVEVEALRVMRGAVVAAAPPSGQLLQLSCYYDVAGRSKVLMKCDIVTAQPPLSLLRIAGLCAWFFKFNKMTSMINKKMQWLNQLFWIIGSMCIHLFKGNIGAIEELYYFFLIHISYKGEFLYQRKLPLKKVIANNIIRLIGFLVTVMILTIATKLIEKIIYVIL